MLSGFLSSSWYVYGWALFERMPEDGFVCKKCEDCPEYKCYPDGADGFCDNPNIIWEPNYETNEDLYNWVTRLDLACEDKFWIGMIGSSYFIGWAVTLIPATRIADIYGRSWIYRIAMIINIIDLVCVYLVRNIYLMIAVNFIMGVVTSARISIGFVYM